MSRAGIIALLLIFIVLPFIAVRAQNSVFADLEKAIDEKDRINIEKNYQIACSKILTSPSIENNIERLFEISHDLLRNGYARLVRVNLARFKTDIGSFSNLPVHLRFLFFSEYGAACYYDNHFSDADSAFRNSILLTDPNDIATLPARATALNFLGLVNRKTGNNKEAFDYFNEAKELRIKVLGKNHPLVGAVYNNIGLLFKSEGDFENAKKYFEFAVEIKQKTNDPSVYANYMNLGELYGVMGNYSASLNYYKKAESLLASEIQNEKAADLYLNTGGILMSMQAYNEAKAYFLKALNIYDLVYGENSEKSGRIYQNLANAYDGTGEFENELKSIEKAIMIFESVFGKDNPETAPVYNNLGLFYMNRNQMVKCLEYLQKARTIYLKDESGQGEKLINTLINIAGVYKSEGQQDSAISIYNQAILKLEGLFSGRHPLLAFSYNSLAEIYMEKKNFNEAAIMVKKAIETNTSGDLTSNGLPDLCLDAGYLFNSLVLTGKIATRQEPGSIKKAIGYFLSADSLLSSQRNFLSDNSDKITLAQHSKVLAEALLQSITDYPDKEIENQAIETAFRLVEKSKNLILLQSIIGNKAKHFAGLPDSLLKQEEDLLSLLHFYSHKLAVEKDQNYRKNIEEKLFTNKVTYNNLVRQIEKNYPEYHSLKYNEQMPEIRQIQNRTDSNLCILSYFLSEKRVYRFTIYKDKYFLDHHEYDDWDDLLTGMRKGISLKLDNVYAEKAVKLYKLLVPENLPESISRLLIIPDGGLSLIPFEALLGEKPEIDDKYSTWPFLIKKYAISYAPSLALWFKSGIPAQETKKQSILAIAPVFGQPENIRLKQNTGNKQSGDSQNSFNPAGVAPLKASLREVAVLDSIFKTNGLQSTTYVKSQATRDLFRSLSIDQYDYIHFATHGFVNESHPELSGLLFYPVSSEDSCNMLYSGEIYNLRFNSRLIVLSACETGMGKIAAGEGLLGFSRAFFYSGARNLLLSLWKVNDISTSELMSQFYSYHLTRGVKLPEALRQAKINLIQDPGYSHPFYWAPFILTGNSME